jgi:hypothetical protein
MLDTAYTRATPPLAALAIRRAASGTAGITAGRINFTKRQQIEVFIRDGYIDRYSGERLLFPGVLRLLSSMFPREFPWHPNWKTGSCHPAYWDLQPTVDHVIPRTNRGLHEMGNWVTTNMINNMAKSNYPLEQIGWRLLPLRNLEPWDGMAGWFLSFVKARPSLLDDPAVSSWYTVLGGQPAHGRAAKPLTRVPASTSQEWQEHWHVHAHLGDGAGKRGHSTGKLPHAESHIHSLDPHDSRGPANAHFPEHCFKVTPGPAPTLLREHAERIVREAAVGGDWRRALRGLTGTAHHV